MTTKELYEALNYVDHSREKRMVMAKLVLNNPDLVRPLIEIVFQLDDPISCKAAWVLEFTSKKSLPFLFPHLDYFTQYMGQVHLQPAVRPMAKICENLMLAYFSTTKNETQKNLTDEHLERITTACFDWLIGNHKVAPKAYSMTSLYLLGTRYDWIHPELQLVLEQNYAAGSAAYKARARHALAKIKKRS